MAESHAEWVARITARSPPSWGGKKLVLCQIRYTGKDEAVGCGRHSYLALASYETPFTCPYCGARNRPKGPSECVLWRLSMAEI